MEPTHVTLTSIQHQLLLTLSHETGKSIAALLAEALAVLQEHERTPQPRREPAPEEGGPAGDTPRLPFWQQALEASQRIPEAELDHLPPDLAAQVDHYLYGTPKR